MQQTEKSGISNATVKFFDGNDNQQRTWLEPSANRKASTITEGKSSFCVNPQAYVQLQRV